MPRPSCTTASSSSSKSTSVASSAAGRRLSPLQINLHRLLHGRPRPEPDAAAAHESLELGGGDVEGNERADEGGTGERGGGGRDGGVGSVCGDEKQGEIDGDGQLGQEHAPVYLQSLPSSKEVCSDVASATELECDEDEFDKEPVDGPIPVMRNLHTLKLYKCELSCKGLNAIIDGCPRLETLLIDGYFNKRKMDKNLKLKCARVKNLTLDTMKKPPYDG
ncbi:hypothetical protein HU200_056118 [Digitaria exilis]|uniref:Uncharacterized protein n=1 Tax=Digitaria exilis TaxID=1010633 RepID=A0A835E5E7_9POAL|nr:hypothetical protein HU200_056118 [Digitaria exilis]